MFGLAIYGQACLTGQSRKKKLQSYLLRQTPLIIGQLVPKMQILLDHITNVSGDILLFNEEHPHIKGDLYSKILTPLAKVQSNSCICQVTTTCW